MAELCFFLWAFKPSEPKRKKCIYVCTYVTFSFRFVCIVMKGNLVELLHHRTFHDLTIRAAKQSSLCIVIIMIAIIKPLLVLSLDMCINLKLHHFQGKADRQMRQCFFYIHSKSHERKARNYFCNYYCSCSFPLFLLHGQGATRDPSLRCAPQCMLSEFVLGTGTGGNQACA